MSQQFGYFQKTKEQIQGLIGQPAATQLINNAVYAFTVGGNDYINNYLAVTTSTKRRYTPPQYQDLLINTYRGQLKVNNLFL